MTRIVIPPHVAAAMDRLQLPNQDEMVPVAGPAKIEWWADRIAALEAHVARCEQIIHDQDAQLTTVQPEPAPAMGADIDDRLHNAWMNYLHLHQAAYDVWRWFEVSRPDLIGPRVEALRDAVNGPRPYGSFADTPTPAQLLADALALEEACRDVIAEREIDGQGDCGCDMCMAVDRMTITIAKLKGVEE